MPKRTQARSLTYLHMYISIENRRQAKPNPAMHGIELIWRKTRAARKTLGDRKTYDN